MKYKLLTLGAAALFAVSVAGGAAAADRNNAERSGNCIAVASSAVQHNGTHPGGTLGEGNNEEGQTGPNHGARGDEIKALQDECNKANEK
jgi:hypothetical protein